jgi:hypothetical protein
MNLSFMNNDRSMTPAGFTKLKQSAGRRRMMSSRRG